MRRRIAVAAPFVDFRDGTSRPAFVAAVLAQFGLVDIVTSDFDHRSKTRIRGGSENGGYAVHYIATPAYGSNVSVLRFLSHTILGLRTGWFFWRRRRYYDVLYVTVPLNLSAWLVLRVSRAKTRIVDIVDIWPDVLPFPEQVRAWMFPLFWIWKRFFIGSVRKATMLLTVSDQFLVEGRRYLKSTAILSKRFFVCRSMFPRSSGQREKTMTVCYVGNIGRLYDFSTLLEAMGTDEFRDRWQVFVVGEGDRKQWLLDEAQRRGVRYEWFGPVYDSGRLGGILRRAHLGFNGYVGTTAAYSYKASTYFAAGLPILNSMKGDLHDVVGIHGVGINYQSASVESLRLALRQCTLERLEMMAGAAERFFRSELEPVVLRKRMTDWLAAAIDREA